MQLAAAQEEWAFVVVLNWLIPVLFHTPLPGSLMVCAKSLRPVEMAVAVLVLEKDTFAGAGYSEQWLSPGVKPVVSMCPSYGGDLRRLGVCL